MKTKTSTILAALIAAALASSASAQLAPDPTGVNLFTVPSAANQANYAADLGPGGLNLYFASQANVPSAEVNTWTNVTSTASISPSIPWLAGGGTVKTIFLGESAGSLNDFGFIRSGANINNVASYNPLATDISNPSPFIQSGWETLVNYGAGEQLDFWLNNPGTFIPGGTYFSFLLNTVGSTFAGGDPYTHVKFKWTPVTTEFTDTNGNLVTGEINTLLIAFEDARGPALPGGALPTIPPGDADFTDFIVGFQFLNTQPSPVPEPSTYGLIGAAALAGLVGYRRFKASKAVKA
jgi:hypothetical protein